MNGKDALWYFVHSFNPSEWERNQRESVKMMQEALGREFKDPLSESVRSVAGSTPDDRKLFTQMVSQNVQQVREDGFEKHHQQRTEDDLQRWEGNGDLATIQRNEFLIKTTLGDGRYYTALENAKAERGKTFFDPPFTGTLSDPLTQPAEQQPYTKPPTNKPPQPNQKPWWTFDYKIF